MRTLILLAVLVLGGCATLPKSAGPFPSRSVAAASTTVFVIKRGWHTDIGFDVADIPAPLSGVESRLSGARYLLFGFGDRHYLMSRNHVGGMLGAVWPGPAILLVTGLSGTPEQAFGKQKVRRLILDADQVQKLQGFIWDSLASMNGEPTYIQPGPYEGSEYYASSLTYSGFNTCNTWTAQALSVAGLSISSSGVAFSGQVWRQVERLPQRQPAAAP